MSSVFREIPENSKFVPMATLNQFCLLNRRRRARIKAAVFSNWVILVDQESMRLVSQYMSSPDKEVFEFHWMFWHLCWMRDWKSIQQLLKLHTTNRFSSRTMRNDDGNNTAVIPEPYSQEIPSMS